MEVIISDQFKRRRSLYLLNFTNFIVCIKFISTDMICVKCPTVRDVTIDIYMHFLQRLDQ